MAEASALLQRALFTALDTGLSVPVYDYVPAGLVSTDFPYVTVGDDIGTDDSSKSDDVQDFVSTIHVWSRQKGRLQTKTLQGLIDDVLHGRTLMLSGSPSMYGWIWRESVTTFLDDDGITHHGVSTFRIRVSDP